MQALSGSCSCGAVRFQLGGAPVAVVNCHCSMCRHASGAAFSTYLVVRQDDLEWQGTAALSEHAVTGSSATRHFCSHCGTPLYNSNPDKYPGMTMVYLGSLQTPERVPPAVNVFCESKLPWVDTLDALPGFAQLPPRPAP